MGELYAHCTCWGADVFGAQIRIGKGYRFCMKSVSRLRAADGFQIKVPQICPARCSVSNAGYDAPLAPHAVFGTHPNPHNPKTALSSASLPLLGLCQHVAPIRFLEPRRRAGGNDCIAAARVWPPRSAGEPLACP